MNAERLLGSLLMGGLGRRRGLLRGDARIALGMGAVALAMAAYEHFVEQRSTRPLPTPAAGSDAPPEQPPTAPPAPPAAGSNDALLLVSAMIAAAAADGVIDAEERAAVMERLAGAGLGEEERGFVERQLAAPPGRDAIVREVASPEVAEQVYTVSLLAVRVDTDEERAYLRGLAADLALPVETLNRIHGALGTALP